MVMILLHLSEFIVSKLKLFEFEYISLILVTDQFKSQINLNVENKSNLGSKNQLFSN